MSAHTTIDIAAEPAVSLRNEPVQARSTARLTALLDAAASIVDEVGIERLTTAMVAERAGASIGTVYRYFPDRIVLLQALGSRNFERVMARITDAIKDPAHADWRGALSTAFASVIDTYRTEPGFRGLRVGDQLDLRPLPNGRTHKSLVAERIVDALSTRFGVENSAASRFTLEAGLEMSDALVARAFLTNPQGDQEFIDISTSAVRGFIGDNIGW
ncbi:TetR/AcrR family transcriptional regulator [Salinibacterium sp. M195]|uniref:TetR/AcrR family transcriptional regulator n=1 Tax=Salinibacterium sp. M195 TaxID=2583374 RepID=UPI0021027207|nr:TetR/AcrR family transcriptional regulator [Salinibacterium sp. M195]QYH35926.1 TetR/AcrR family transcriptional regulator [Salinibacterium sp. M195]